MILAVDVHYEGERARAAAISFADWRSSEAISTEVREGSIPAAYRPGRFFERELPCILPVVQTMLAASAVDVVVVDGYVDLGPASPGLGRMLFEALGGRVAIVGVAKTRFRSAPARELTRGRSRAALFITATGDLDAAVAGVASMAGPHRIPTLLKRVDHLARGER